MRMLFSFVSLIIVVGIIVWLNMRDVELLTQPRPSTIKGQESVLTPIDQAKEAKRLIESKNSVLP